MSRAVGAIPLLRDLLPAVAIDGFAAATWLGSVPVVGALAVAAYWFGPRERGATGVAAVIAAFALTIGLKGLVGLPRPPAALHWVPATGFGFPSGHAIAATVGWGVLALALDRGSARLRVGLATLVVATVGASRVALGVHYLVDVVAGVAVGLAVLAVADRLDRPERTFGLASVAAVFAFAVSGTGGALLLFGGAVAGGLLWPHLDVPTRPWGRDEVLPAVGYGGGIGALVAGGWGRPLGTPVALVIGAIAVGSALAVPTLVERVRRP